MIIRGHVFDDGDWRENKLKIMLNMKSVRVSGEIKKKME